MATLSSETELCIYTTNRRITEADGRVHVMGVGAWRGSSNGKCSELAAISEFGGVIYRKRIRSAASVYSTVEHFRS